MFRPANAVESQSRFSSIPALSIVGDIIIAFPVTLPAMPISLDVRLLSNSRPNLSNAMPRVSLFSFAHPPSTLMDWLWLDMLKPSMLAEASP